MPQKWSIWVKSPLSNCHRHSFSFLNTSLPFHYFPFILTQPTKSKKQLKSHWNLIQLPRCSYKSDHINFMTCSSLHRHWFFMNVFIIYSSLHLNFYVSNVTEKKTTMSRTWSHIIKVHFFSFMQNHINIQKYNVITEYYRFESGQ